MLNIYISLRNTLYQLSVYILYTYEKLIHLDTFIFGRVDETVNNKRKQQRKRGKGEDAKKKPVKIRRRIASPKRLTNDHESVEKSHNSINSENRDQYKHNEDSYRAVTERWNSSSREDGSRMEKQKAGTSTDDDRDRIERRNADDDEKSEEANVEHDTNDTIRQMDP